MELKVVYSTVQASEDLRLRVLGSGVGQRVEGSRFRAEG